MKQNELSRMAVNALRDAGVSDASLANISDVENDAPFIAAVMNSGLIAAGMTGLRTLDRDELSPTDLDVLVKASRGMHAGDAWIRGDIMLYVRNNRYNGGDIPRTHMEEYAKQFGCSAKRLINNMTTSAAWELGTRYPSNMLGNTQHEMLNALPANERVAWAERAIAEGMTVVQLRDSLLLDAAAVHVTTAASGLTVSEPGFISDAITPIDAARHMYKWYEAEIAKTGSPKQAFENVILSFHENGLLKFPLSKWAAAMS